MANTKKTNGNTPTIKPKKPGWIRACFGLGSFHEARFVSDQPPIKEEETHSGGRKRKNLGSRILGVVKRPWCKKRNKTTSFKGGSTASKGAAAGIQKSLLLHPDEEQVPTEGHIQEENVLTKSFSKSKTEDASIHHNTKVKNPIVEEEDTKLKKVSSSAQFSAKQSSLKNAERAEKDAFIGMSILIIVLVIMMLCGRLCAILFTSITFYCMPQLIKTSTKTIKYNVQASSVKSIIDRGNAVLMGFLGKKRNIFC